MRQQQLPLLGSRGKPKRGKTSKRMGRPPNGGKAGVPHLKRPALARRFPVHVTLSMAEHVYNLRSGRCFREIKRAFWLGHDRKGFRMNEFSVQGNHIHLICEAEDERVLARGVQGLSVRIAKALNRVMKRKGRVFADRYHARILRTPTEVRNAVNYVHQNHRKHEAQRGNVLPASFRDPYSSAVVSDSPPTGPPLIAPPQTWLLQQASRRIRSSVFF